MTAEEHFRWEWRELAGKLCLAVAPLGMADNERWIAFFEEVSRAFPDGEAFFIVDARKIENKIGVDGFKGILDSLKGQGVERATFAVITTDKFHSMTARMFRSLADMSGFDLQTGVFFEEDAAKSWIETQISRPEC